MTDSPSAPQNEQHLRVPDRFESLRDVGEQTLRSLITPVEAELTKLDDRFEDMAAAGRGGFLILRGDSGSGKSTFLDTVGLFRQGVHTITLPATDDVAKVLMQLPRSDAARLIVLEGREALLDVSTPALEKSMHAINSFIKGPTGHATLVVWPTNTDELANALASLGAKIGGSALLGTGGGIVSFSGPPREQFVGIGERTLGALNQGTSFTDLGLTADSANEIASRVKYVGDFLTELRAALRKNGAHVRKLLKTEQPRLWIVVVAGNDPDGDVAAVTRGGSARADIDRLMGTTSANIVATLKEEPDTLGILGTVLDARVLHLEQIAALAVAREYADERLRSLMKEANLSTARDKAAVTRIRSSELGLVLTDSSLGTRRRGGRAGSETKKAFLALANIASKNDGLLNRAVGEALVDAGLIDSYELEEPLGTTPKYFTDLLIKKGSERIRIEFMWRSTTGRADISNYVLGKLANYAKAIGLLKP